jgi:hypothetical protein
MEQQRAQPPHSATSGGEQQPQQPTHQPLQQSHHDQQQQQEQQQQLAACSYGAWYAAFASLAASESVVLPLPRAFVDFLLHGSLVLPEDCQAVSVLALALLGQLQRAGCRCRCR